MSSPYPLLHGLFLELRKLFESEPPVEEPPEEEEPPVEEPPEEEPPIETGEPVSVEVKPESWDFRIGDTQSFRAVALNEQGVEVQWPTGTEFLWEPRAHRNASVKVEKTDWARESISVVTAVKAGESSILVSTRGSVQLVSKTPAKATVAGESEEEPPEEEPEPEEPPPPTGGSDVTPQELASLLGPIQPLSKDLPEFGPYNAGIEKGMKQFMSTYASGNYTHFNGSAQQNNPHYGTLRRVVYWCLRHGKPLDPSKVPELKAAIDVIGQAAKWYYETGNPNNLNVQMYRSTHAVDFALFIWFMQNAPAGSNDEYLRECAENWVWANAAQATSGWSEATRVTDINHTYASGAREWAQTVELWRVATFVGSPFRRHPNTSAGFTPDGPDWAGCAQAQIVNANTLLDKAAAAHTGADPRGVQMMDGDWRVAGHSGRYKVPGDTTSGLHYPKPYPIAIFATWMAAHQALAAERDLGCSGGYALGARIAKSLMRYYKPANQSFGYLSHFVGAPTGGDNPSPDLNMFGPAPMIRLEDAGLITGGRAMALDLVRGTAKAGGFGWRWKQDQELASVNEGPCTAALLAGVK